MTKRKVDDLVANYIIDNREYYYRLAYSYVKNQEDALDIVQESICKALDSKSKIKNVDGIKTWFYRIVVNCSIDFIRKNKRVLYVEDSLLEINGEKKTDVYEDLDLKNAIDKLPTINKTIVILRYFEDMKLEEIAEILDENINTVKTKLYKSLKILKLDASLNC